MKYVTAKPSLIRPIASLVFNIFLDMMALLAGAWIWFTIGIVITAAQVCWVFHISQNGIVVDDKGVRGKATGNKFQLEYRQITSVGEMKTDSGKGLTLAAGYKTYNITVKKAREVCEAIHHNLELLGLNPGQAQPNFADVTTTPFAAEARDISAATVITLEQLRQHVVEICRQEFTGKEIDKFYMCEQIPPKKMQNAIKSFAPTCNYSEKPILFYDNTIIGSGKNGFLLTTKSFYAKPSMGSAETSYIHSIVAVHNDNVKKDSCDIVINLDMGKVITIDAVGENKNGERVAITNVLARTIALLNSSQLQF